MKKNLMITVCFTLVAALIIGYVNIVYIPAKKAEAAAAFNTQETKEDVTYNYPLRTEEDIEKLSAEPTTDNSSKLTTTTESDGSVTIHREWDDTASGIDLTDAPPSSEGDANIAAGEAANIVDGDGIYYGDDEPEQTPEPPKPTEKPETSSKPQESPKPATPAPSSTPKMGDKRINAEGKEEVYVAGFGWIVPVEGETHEFHTETTGEYVGSFG